MATAERTCSDCGKWYLRGNRFRFWKLTMEDGKVIYAKSDVKICPKCLDKREVATIIKITSAHIG